MTNALSSLPPDIARNRVLNTAEAASFTGFSIPHFRRPYRTGAVPAPLRLSERKLGWRAGDLADWLSTRQSRPVAAWSSTMTTPRPKRAPLMRAVRRVDGFQTMQNQPNTAPASCNGDPRLHEEATSATHDRRLTRVARSLAPTRGDGGGSHRIDDTRSLTRGGADTIAYRLQFAVRDVDVSVTEWAVHIDLDNPGAAAPVSRRWGLSISGWLPLAQRGTQSGNPSEEARNANPTKVERHRWDSETGAQEHGTARSRP